MIIKNLLKQQSYWWPKTFAVYTIYFSFSPNGH